MKKGWKGLNHDALRRCKAEYTSEFPHNAILIPLLYNLFRHATGLFEALALC